MALSYEDLKTKSEKKAKEKSVPFIAKDGKEVRLRPLFQLSKVEMKNALSLVDALQKSQKNGDESSVEFQLDAVDQLIVIASDRKRAMKASLDDLDAEARMEIFEAWMKAVQVPEASASTS